jgi:hypothetical protein
MRRAWENISADQEGRLTSPAVRTRQAGLAGSLSAQLSCQPPLTAMAAFGRLRPAALRKSGHPRTAWRNAQNDTEPPLASKLAWASAASGRTREASQSPSIIPARDEHRDEPNLTEILPLELIEIGSLAGLRGEMGKARVAGETNSSPRYNREHRGFPGWDRSASR